ncbi:TVB4 protein, partial [Polypterus senegalus]
MLTLDAAFSTKLKQKEHLILTPGENAEMMCEQDGADQQMYWYRQRGGQGMQLILFSMMENIKTEKELGDDRFSGNRTERKSFLLGIINVQKNDSFTFLRFQLSRCFKKPKR